jgi:hypothetical protein
MWAHHVSSSCETNLFTYLPPLQHNNFH